MTDTPRYWKPLIKLHPDEMFRRREVVLETMKHYKIDEAAANKMLDEEDAKCDCYVNDIYQVQTQIIKVDLGGEEPEDCMHVNIRRRDGAADLRDWRHFQQIKNEVAGPNREAIEMYPAESRKVDTSNKWHLWVLPEDFRWPFGWLHRDVQYEENRDVPGLRQRKL